MHAADSRGDPHPPGEAHPRAPRTAGLARIVVGVVYNLLVPGTGTAPAWVSAILHLVFPALVVADWVFAPDRLPLPWRRLWIVVPYPLLWLTVVLLRGATDGWVPYGFLLPENGALSVSAHIMGLLVALLAAGALVWAASRLRRTTPPGSSRPVHSGRRQV